MYWSSFEPNSGTRAPDVHTVQAAVSKMETIKSSEPTRRSGTTCGSKTETTTSTWQLFRTQLRHKQRLPISPLTTWVEKIVDH